MTIEARSRRRDRLAADGRFREAGVDARAVVARWSTRGRSAFGEVARARVVLAGLLDRQGRDAEAVALYDSALATAARIRPAADGAEAFTESDRVEVLRRSARALRRMGEATRAASRAEKALGSARQAFGPEDSRTVAARIELGHARFEQGEFRAAIEGLREGAVAIGGGDVEASLADASLEVLVTSARLGESLRRVGRTKEALRVTEPSRDAIVSRLGAEDPAALLARLTVARCQAEIGRRRPAERELLALRRELARAFGGRHPWTLDASRALVALYEAWEKPEKAARFRRGLPERERKAAGTSSSRSSAPRPAESTLPGAASSGAASPGAAR